MSSNEIAVRVENLGKRYEVYDSPRNRLKQFIIPPIRNVLGSTGKDYFKEYWALRDISFEIKRGESFGVVGRNGSGKSTLLQLVTGTLAPTTGTIFTQGRIAALLELGSGFNPDYTGRENVFLNGMLLGMSQAEIEQRFDAIAAFADIGEYLEQPVKTYSSGMLVRLAFAVQVQVEPDILIVDEALAVGDALFQKRCYERIERLLADGVTLMFVSHDQESVRTLTHRSILLHRGKPVFCGPSSEAILAYRKLLHEEESAYFSAIAGNIEEKKKQGAAAVIGKNNSADNAGEVLGRSDSMSFGDGGMEITSVGTFDQEGNPCAVFYPGDTVRICVESLSGIDTDKINVAIRIRSREGIKVYSWGTLNQDMQVLAGLQQGPLYWGRHIRAGEKFSVWFEFASILGVNLYEIQASLSYEGKPDYTEQRMLHWVDEAAFFQVLMRQKEYFFGGSTDLQMTAKWAGQ
ncbi:MAG: sugar ABC transporter ATP-binding protein [Methylobacter sp.]|nr:MAG: sugar ABC transporter ATP-binding protein [Methylobacter sp.]